MSTEGFTTQKSYTDPNLPSVQYVPDNFTTENPRAPRLHCSVFFSDSYQCARVLTDSFPSSSIISYAFYSDNDRVVMFILMRGAGEIPPKALAIIHNYF